MIGQKMTPRQVLSLLVLEANILSLSDYMSELAMVPNQDYRKHQPPEKSLSLARMKLVKGITVCEDVREPYIAAKCYSDIFRTISGSLFSPF